MSVSVHHLVGDISEKEIKEWINYTSHDASSELELISLIKDVVKKIHHTQHNDVLF